MKAAGEKPEGQEVLSGESRRAGANDELSRLRHTNALNAEVISSLRSLQQLERQRDVERSHLIAAVSAQIGTQWRTVQQQSTERAHGMEFERTGALLEDLVDFTAACAGTLALEREPVHLPRFLRQILMHSGAARRADNLPSEIGIRGDVSPWVLADARRLAKILQSLIDTILDDRASKIVSFQLEASEALLPGQNPAEQAVVLEIRSSSVSSAAASGDRQESIAASLRAALAEQLRAQMNAVLQHKPDAQGLQLWQLALPFEMSRDPVTAGERERIDDALSELLVDAEPVAASESAAGAEVALEGEGAIDYPYLDRQLGSLAQPVLARTAPAFLALIDERLTKLVVAHGMSDLERLRDLAQAWKASAMSIGARPLAGLLGAIERQAGAGHLPTEGSIRQVSDGLMRLRAALASAGALPRAAT